MAHGARRLVGAVAVGALGIGIAVVAIPGQDPARASDRSTLRSVLEEETAAAEPVTPLDDGATGDPQAADGHDDGHGDGHEHAHPTDPAERNAISQDSAVLTDPATADPTTPEEAAASRLAAAAQRAESIPITVPVADQVRSTFPGDRFAMAGGCYALQAPSGRWLGADLTIGPKKRKKATRLHFRATDLGVYLLYTADRRFVAAGDRFAAKPSPRTEWTATRNARGRFALTNGGERLAGSRFLLRNVAGCTDYPEAEVNISGNTFRGVSSMQEVRGYVDAHTHGMAFEFLGGKVHCGRPWHPYGVEFALVDCPDHMVANGKGAVLEDALAGATPGTGHDPVGWPTFKDWPAPDSLTHEGTYYKWMERAHQGGLRILVNLLVENNQLCNVYPLKKNSCNDMNSIRLQAQRMREFERYIDAQYGGPGKGWYRIVTDPFQARQVINAGKLAVIMGIETSVVFGCSMKLDIPSCSKASIDRQLQEVHDLGVRQMELVNKFDNALAGVAGDTGTIAPLINGANFLETLSFWNMQKCPEGYADGVSDRSQLTVAPDGVDRDQIFGTIFQLFGSLPASLPIYGPAPHCNKRGLTDLGDHLIRRMVEKNMIVDPDHMSVAARQKSLDLLESLDYSGVVSSHSWSTPDAYPRIYELGGFVSPYAGDSEGFVDKWRQHLEWVDERYYFGFGFGADINGFGAQGGPRGTDVDDPVTYPFTGLGGVRVDKQRSGQRVYDINADGVAHYGLYPDWIEDLRKVAGPDGAAISEDMARGAEAYLQMWERALGVGNDGCRDAEALRPVSAFTALSPGLSSTQVLQQVGQPHSRRGTTYTFCALDPQGGEVEIAVDLTPSGTLTGVRIL